MSGGNDEREHFDQLLTEMDGLELIQVTANCFNTNGADVLDKALMRCKVVLTDKLRNTDIH
jgi:ATP-dependent Zn protease